MNLENTSSNEEGHIRILHPPYYFAGEVYASDMIDELTAAHYMIVVEGALYPLLTRLKTRGW